MGLLDVLDGGEGKVAKALLRIAEAWDKRSAISRSDLKLFCDLVGECQTRIVHM